MKLYLNKLQKITLKLAKNLYFGQNHKIAYNLSQKNYKKKKKFVKIWKKFYNFVYYFLSNPHLYDII